MSWLSSIRMLAGTAILVLLTLIVLSSIEMPLMAGLRATTDTRWGVTTLVDLYVGVLAVWAWIVWRERSAWRSGLWLLALVSLGNLATAVYVLMASLRAHHPHDLFRPVRP